MKKIFKISTKRVVKSLFLLSFEVIQLTNKMAATALNIEMINNGYSMHFEKKYFVCEKLKARMFVNLGF